MANPLKYRADSILIQPLKRSAHSLQGTINEVPEPADLLIGEDQGAHDQADYSKDDVCLRRRARGLLKESMSGRNQHGCLLPAVIGGDHDPDTSSERAPP